VRRLPQRQDAANLGADVDEGGRTLTYFTVNKAHMGGKLKLHVDRIDSDEPHPRTHTKRITLELV